MTHDSVSLLLCDMEDEEEVDTNVLHIPIDNIVEMTVPEEGLCCEIKFSNNLISGKIEHALEKASQYPANIPSQIRLAISWLGPQ